MATNHTANYNLNLWEPNDKFVRTEFNENTQKLDTALKAEADARAAAVTAETTARTAADQDLDNRKAAFVLLKEVTLTQKVSRIDINLSDIDWGAWQYVFLDIDVEGSGMCYLQANGSGDHISSVEGTTSVSKSLAGYMKLYGLSRGIRIQFNVCKAPARRLSTIFPNGYGYSVEPITYATLSSLNIAPNSVSSNPDVGPNGTVRLWGLA